MHSLLVCLQIGVHGQVEVVHGSVHQRQFNVFVLHENGLRYHLPINVQTLEGFHAIVNPNDETAAFECIRD